MKSPSRGVVLAEWTKLRSLRSTWLTVAVAVLLSAVLGALAAESAVHAWPTMAPPDRAAFDAVQTSLDGGIWAELAFGVLGVLSVSAEYRTGLIRTTFVAVPQRGMVLAAKVVVVCGGALVVGEALSFSTFLLGQAILSQQHLAVGVTSPHVLRSLVAAGAYLTVLTAVGMALGALLRHTAAAIGAWFALLYLAYGFARALQAWSHVPDRWLLVNIGDSLTRLRPAHDTWVPSLAGAAAELAVYAAAALVLAGWRFRQDP
ncbi:ABC transporter permease [Acidothermaceae bacterium B102]|nr:ABC transporter permease [Acidothermaceae bacterium B102]